MAQRKRWDNYEKDVWVIISIYEKENVMGNRLTKG